jgi:hypothetical protein
MVTAHRLFGVPIPAPHDSIFGWILQLSDDHQVTVDDVIRAAGLYDVRSDVDFGLNATGWRELAAFAQLPTDSFIHARALRAGLAKRPSIASRVLRRSTDGKLCYAFCAECMRGDAGLHLPIEWRFEQFRVCPRHRTWLATRCHHCDAHLTLEQLAAVRREVSKHRNALLGLCPSCRKPLRSRWTRRHASTDLRVEVEYQHRVLAAIVHGYCRLDGVTRTFSLNTALAIDDWETTRSEGSPNPAHSLLSTLEGYGADNDEAAFLRRLLQMNRPGYGYRCGNYILERRWESPAMTVAIPPRVRELLESMTTQGIA